MSSSRKKHLSILFAVTSTLLYIAFLLLSILALIYMTFLELRIIPWLVSIIRGLVLLGLIYLLARIVKNKKEPIFRVVERKWYYIALLLGLLFCFLQVPLDYLQNILLGTDHHYNIYFTRFHNLKNPIYISTILIVPIAEELLFRRLILEKLQNAYNVWFAVILVSFLFASIHLPFDTLLLDFIYDEDTIFSRLSIYHFHQTYITFFGGILAGWIYIKSKSVIPAILFHVSWNFFATIL